MARVRKFLLRTGVHQTGNGPLVATRKRAKRWAEQARKMLAAGIKIPVAWGHQPDAEPYDPADPKAAKAARQYHLSKFNAGYLEDLTFDEATGDLHFVADVPGARVRDKQLLTDAELPGGLKVQAAVGEVSAAIRDWKDGRGRLWKDSIIHVALTPLPVVDKQPGFEQLAELSTLAGPAGATYLGAKTYLRELAMADHDDDYDDEAGATDEGGDDEGAADYGDDEGAEGNAEAPPPAPEPPPPPPPPAEPQAPAHFAEALKVLQEHGLHLPPGTTPENAWERICVLGHHDREKGESEEEEEEGADGGMPGSGGEDQGLGEEEQRPIMMSLATAKTPAEKKLLQRLTDNRKQGHRRTLSAQRKRVERAVKKGMKPKMAAGYLERIERCLSRLDGYELSLDDDGKPVGKPVDFAVNAIVRELDQAEDLLVLAKPAIDAYLLGAEEEARPSTDQADPQDIQARAARVSRAGK